MQELLRASILAVRGPYTERALSRGSNVSCLYSEKFQTQNLLFGLHLTSRSFYTHASWLCVVRTLDKHFAGKAMFLFVCTAHSFQHRIYFLGLRPTSRSFCAQAFWLCVVQTLNKRFRGWVMFLVCSAQSSQHGSYFFSTAHMEELLHASSQAAIDPFTEQALS